MFDYAAHGLIESPIKLPLPGNGPQTIGAILDRHLVENAHRPALVGRSARYSYGELHRQVARATAAFQQRGIRPYDRIAACLPNDVDIVVALLACARAGAIWVGVNRPLAAPEKAAILLDSGASLYLTDPEGCAQIKPQLKGLPALQEVLCADRDSPNSSWHELLQAVSPGDAQRVAVDSFEPAAIAYTSGTTGTPKGAVHSHHNILLPGAIEVDKGSYGVECPQGVMLPLTILNLMVLAPMVAFQDGSYCVCMDSLKPEDVARWVRDERVGHFASVPTVIQDLLTSPKVDPQDLATLGRPDIGGAGIAENIQTLYRERFGRKMTVAYGMTEAPTIVTRTDPDKAPEEELCGRAVAQIEIRIVDEKDQGVAQGEIGEICVLPAGTGAYANIYTTMLGYWDRPKVTVASLAGGMYHSGDLGYLDESGQLYIRGRQNDLIIRGGANVYPAEVERVLVAHPGIKDAAVLGMEDARLGQRVVAAVEILDTAATVEQTAQLTDEIQSYCQQHLARYKVPEQIRFVEQLPRNAMNKIVKPKLKALF
ncbi:MAG: long-chain acyl-CoA synthetase [Halioglobus sp.]|jgi:long-chain acyl-CoA synthetase